MIESYDVIIVGAGAAGTELAKIISRSGAAVAVLEYGEKNKGLGSLKRAVQLYDGNKLTQHPAMTREGYILWRALTAGGSALVALNNMVPSMADSFHQYGIEIGAEMTAFLEEIEVAPLDDNLLSDGGRAIQAAGERLGIPFQTMPKGITTEYCTGCGLCPFGCPESATWSPLISLHAAKNAGADIYYQTRVEQVLIENGRAVGVLASNGSRQKEFYAKIVILSAGGIGTPIILQRSGIEEAGQQLFMDLFVTTAGVTESFNQLGEPSMALLSDQFRESDGFILSPYIPVHSKVAFAEYGPAGLLLKRGRMIGLMAKTKDDLQGSVAANGEVSKTLTPADKDRLSKGAEVSKQILIEAGAKANSILTSKPQGAHPGGTAAIGQVVDNNLQTRIPGLYVCDASVFPEAPGLPPIVPIIGLARWFAKRVNTL